MLLPREDSKERNAPGYTAEGRLRDSHYVINTVTKSLKSGGSVCERDQNQWEGRTETLVLTVRKEIGENIALLVDSNSCYTPRKAIQVGPRC